MRFRCRRQHRFARGGKRYPEDRHRLERSRNPLCHPLPRALADCLGAFEIDDLRGDVGGFEAAGAFEVGAAGDAHGAEMLGRHITGA